jgi:hypothetical protein
MYNTLNLSIFSLYLKALEFILAPNLKKKCLFYFRSRIVGFTLVRVIGYIQFLCMNKLYIYDTNKQKH